MNLPPLPLLIRQAISRRSIFTVAGAFAAAAGSSGALAQTVLGAGKTPPHLRSLQPDASSKQTGYTHVVEATVPGRIVYVAGQMGLDGNGNLVGAPGDFKAQATQAWENVRNALAAAAAGSSISSRSRSFWCTCAPTRRCCARCAPSSPIRTCRRRPAPWCRSARSRGKARSTRSRRWRCCRRSDARKERVLGEA